MATCSISAARGPTRCADNEQVLEEARKSNDRALEGRALGNLATQAIELRRYAEAIEPLQRSRELSQSLGYRRGEAIALRNLGYAQLKNGQAAAAEASLREAIALQEALRSQTAASDRFNVSLFETQRDAHRTLQAALVAQNRPEAALVAAEQGRVDGVNLYARSATCFPTLKVPPLVKSSLRDVVRIDGAGMSFGLKLRQMRQMFDSSVGADLARRIKIRFNDVTVVSVTLLDLRAALDRKACPDIAPLVDVTLAPMQPDQRPDFVNSEVLVGQREAKLKFRQPRRPGSEDEGAGAPGRLGRAGGARQWRRHRQPGEQGRRAERD